MTHIAIPMTGDMLLPLIGYQATQTSLIRCFLMSGRCLCAGALDACAASQALHAVNTVGHEGLSSIAENASLPKDAVKGLTASAWAADLDAQHAQKARLAALRVHASMLLAGAADSSKTLPFTRGDSSPRPSPARE